jgi:hypothetical protein
MSILPLSGIELGAHDGEMASEEIHRMVTRDSASKRRIDRKRSEEAFQPTDRQRQEGGARATTLLLIDLDSGYPLTARRNRWWRRLMARLLAPYLDHQLAQGRSPEESGLLGARAQVLVSPIMRIALAEDWSNILDQARKPPAARTHAVPFNRHCIVASEQEIGEMIEALVASVPIAVRGSAMASWLLSDGAGPLYDRRRSADLTGALREATAQLGDVVLL